MGDNGKKTERNAYDKNGAEKTQIVIPGEKIGVIEEYLPGQGTYVKDGNIISSIIANKEISRKTRNISVTPMNPLVIPVIGGIIEGQVNSIQEKMANVRILKIGEEYPSGSFTGMIHISTASEDYVKIMTHICKPGDIVRAKVISDKNRVYHLSTAERNLGVIYAFCSKCGNALIKKGRSLQCCVCNNIEERKIANDYGNNLT